MTTNFDRMIALMAVSATSPIPSASLVKTTEAEPFAIVYDEPSIAEVKAKQGNSFRKGKRRGKKFWEQPGGGKY